MVRVDVGAVPVSAVQHDDKKLVRKGTATAKLRGSAKTRGTARWRGVAATEKKKKKMAERG